MVLHVVTIILTLLAMPRVMVVAPPTHSIVWIPYGCTSSIVGSICNPLSYLHTCNVASTVLHVVTIILTLLTMPRVVMVAPPTHSIFWKISQCVAEQITQEWLIGLLRVGWALGFILFKVIYLHEYFQIFSYFIWQNFKNPRLSCRNTRSPF